MWSKTLAHSSVEAEYQNLALATSEDYLGPVASA